MRRVLFIVCVLLLMGSKKGESATFSEDRILPIDSVIRENAVKKEEGLFNSYEQDGAYYLEIPEDKLGRDILVSITLLRGSAQINRDPSMRFGYGGDSMYDRLMRFVKNGGIMIPPGVTISFTNKGYCMDPHLPAPKAGEEYQLVPVTQLIPEDLQGTYKKLVQKASAGDESVKRNMQHLVWALRTAGTDAAYDYKAVFADVEKNLFGFRAYGGNGDVYSVFSYDAAEGFRKVFSRELTYGGDARGLYAGERFYLVVGNTVESYTLSGFEKIDDIVLGSIEPLAVE